MTLMTREAILGLTARRYMVVGLPDGKQVRIQSLSEREKSSFEMQQISKRGSVNKSKIEASRRRLLCLCLVDDKGNRLFGDDDADKLRDVDGGITSALFDAVQKHVGFEDGDIEELAKNSNAIQGDDSDSD